MLERLIVQGLGIIDAVEIELTPGFVALTGETGAGKSLLVTSLELLAGRRASAELVRTGDDRLRVEGWFGFDRGSGVEEILDEIGAADGSQLVIRREVSATGRGRCWVNDVSVTANTLQQMAPLDGYAVCRTADRTPCAVQDQYPGRERRSPDAPTARFEFRFAFDCQAVA